MKTNCMWKCCECLLPTIFSPHRKILCPMILLINKSASPLHRSNYWELVHHWWWWCRCLRVDKNRPFRGPFRGKQSPRIVNYQLTTLPPNQALVEISGLISCYFRSCWLGSKPTHYWPIYHIPVDRTGLTVSLCDLVMVHMFGQISSDLTRAGPPKR